MDGPIFGFISCMWLVFGFTAYAVTSPKTEKALNHPSRGRRLCARLAAITLFGGPFGAAIALFFTALFLVIGLFIWIVNLIGRD